jgi:hypothetical protein
MLNGLAGGAGGAANSLGGALSAATAGKAGIPVYVTNWGGTPGPGGVPEIGGGSTRSMLGAGASMAGKMVPLAALAIASQEMLMGVDIGGGTTARDAGLGYGGSFDKEKFLAVVRARTKAMVTERLSASTANAGDAAIGGIAPGSGKGPWRDQGGGDQHFAFYLDSKPIAASVEKRLVQNVKNNSRNE